LGFPLFYPLISQYQYQYQETKVKNNCQRNVPKTLAFFQEHPDTGSNT
jgi:hypothetical protein